MAGVRNDNGEAGRWPARCQARSTPLRRSDRERWAATSSKRAATKRPCPNQRSGGGARSFRPYKRIGTRPAKRRGHGADFGDGYKEGVAEQQASESRGGDGENSGCWCLIYGLHFGEHGRDGLSAAIGEQQARGGHEIAVENLQESDKRNGQNDASDLYRMRSLFEGDRRREPLADETLPGGNVGNRTNNEYVEASADQERHGDGFEEVARREPWMSLFRHLGHGLKAGDEIRHDLQGEQDRHQGRMTEQGLEVRRGAAPATDGDHHKKHQQDGGGGPVLEGSAGADAPIIQITEKKREQQAEEQARKKDRHAGNAVEFDGVELGKKTGRQFSDRDRFPRADDEVGEEHNPAG